MREFVEIHRRAAVVRIHSDRCCVYQYFAVGELFEIIVVVFAGAGDYGYSLCAAVRCHGSRGQRGAAAAENDDLFACKIYSRALCHGFEAEIVGVESVKPVRCSDNGVDAAYFLSLRADV